MTLDDLITVNQVQTISPPRQLNSIPQLLSSLQNEYDSIALEMFNLRKTLEDTRKELSTALYHHDAAVRVASRLLEERDEARKALQELTLNISNGEVEEPKQQIEEGSMPEDLSEKISNSNQNLFQINKQKKNKINVKIDYNFETYKENKVVKPYDSLIAFNSNRSCILITGKTGKSSFYDVPYSKIIKIDGKIEQSKDITFISSIGKDCVIGTSKGEIIHNKTFLNTNHKDSIISILPHPELFHIVITIDKSGLLSIIDLNLQQVLFNNRVSNDAIVADIHTDGALIAVGNSTGEIIIVDLRNGSIVTTFKTNSEIIDLKFGFNGYWLFSSSIGKILDIWDLRKYTSFRITTKNDINKIRFDKSSQLIFAIDNNSYIEFIQYNKSDKTWVFKNELEFKDLIDLVVTKDDEENKIELTGLKSNSEITKILL